MQTMARPQDGSVLAPARSAAVEAYFETLRREQNSYAIAVGRAAALLRNEPGQLAFVAATHTRLIQQFFDAQRLILMRRADVDAEVMRIARAADADAIATVGAARARAAVAGPGRAGALNIDKSAGETATAEAMTPRQAVAALGVSVVRTMAEVDSLATVIDQAFEPDEPDCVVARRQLTAMLDEWWASEQQEGAAAIDDAHARAAMRRHVAAVEANEIAGVPAEQICTVERPVPPRVDLPVLLPTDVLAALDTATALDLSALLDSLVRSVLPPVDAIEVASVEELADMPMVVDGPDHALDEMVSMDPARAPVRVGGLRVREAAETIVEPGHDFWAAGVAAPRSRALSRWWIPVFVAAPLGLAGGVFAMTLKLVG